MKQLVLLALMAVCASCQAKGDDTEQLRVDIRKLTESIAKQDPSLASWGDTLKAHAKGRSGWTSLSDLCVEFDKLSKSETGRLWNDALGSLSEPTQGMFSNLETEDQELLLKDTASFAKSFSALGDFDRLVPQSEEDVLNIQHYAITRVFAFIQNRLVLQALLGSDQKALIASAQNLLAITGKLSFGVSEGPMMLESIVRRRTLQTLATAARLTKDSEVCFKSMNVVSALEAGTYDQLSGRSGIAVLAAGVVVRARAEIAKNDETLRRQLNGFEEPSDYLRRIKDHLRGLELVVKAVPERVTTFSDNDNARLLQRVVEDQDNKDDPGLIEFVGEAVGAIARVAADSLLYRAYVRLREFELGKGKFPNLDELEVMFPQKSSVTFDPKIGGNVILQLSDRHPLQKTLGAGSPVLEVAPFAQE